jgi:hypothetical protein
MSHIVGTVRHYEGVAVIDCYLILSFLIISQRYVTQKEVIET